MSNSTVLKSIYTKEDKKSIPWVVGGVHKPLTEDTSGVSEYECAHCGRPLFFKPGPNVIEIHEAACGSPVNCYRELEWSERFPSAFADVKREAPAGSKSLSTASSDRSPCEECGGRPWHTDGHKHTADCSHHWKNEAAAAKASREPCPSCGGPPGRARGWKHKPDCLELPANKPCPECSGAKVVGGFDHTDKCSRNKGGG